jgi:antitoxin component YwqK of YwqJK toxin-antitoxin module
VEVAAGYYKNGLKTGPWIYKTESGKIKERELYKNGKLASQKETEEFFAKTKTAEPGKTETKKQEPKK